MLRTHQSDTEETAENYSIRIWCTVLKIISYSMLHRKQLSLCQHYVAVKAMSSGRARHLQLIRSVGDTHMYVTLVSNPDPSYLYSARCIASPRRRKVVQYSGVWVRN